MQSATIAGMTNTTLSTLSDAIASIVEAVSPAVVQVQGHRRSISGVALEDGGVLTMLSGIRQDEGLRVRRHDGQTLPAELAGWDPPTGLAVLRVADLGLAPAPRSEESPRVGSVAVAIARSWSNAVTASVGTVAVIGGPLQTGRRRSIEQVVRTTAPMHDGFAGGAFVGPDGKVVGIATATSIRGLGVVIPGPIAWRAASDVLKHGRPRRGYIGIAGQAVELGTGQRGAAGRDRGFVVVGLTRDEPADRAGVLIGDILIEADGHPVVSAEDILDLLTADRVGHALGIKLVRGTALQEISVTVKERTA
jgi:S1-C subfamily serine protease